MDGKLVFTLTPKGEEEFAHRRHHLNQVLRRVLIMIDGKSSVARLIERGTGLSDVPTALQILASEGFIRTVEEASRGESGVGNPKTEIIALARAMFGDRGAKVVKKIEDSADAPQTLSQAIDSCRKLICLFIDEQRADEFARRAKEILFAAAGRDS
jgi:hypothetical protein